MRKVLIIDDEPLARMLVKEYLQSFPELEIIQECNDGFEGVKAIQQHKPDLVFLDIQMPKINGFEMLELIDNPPSVIFATAFDEYAIKAFEAHAADYLLKPFSKERFDKAVNKWLLQEGSSKLRDNAQQLQETIAQNPAAGNRIVVKSGDKIKIIPVAEALYLEAADDYVKVHTPGGYFLKNKTMAHFEKILDTNIFCRCHRSYLVNIHYITKIAHYEKDSHIALLKNGAKVPVSRSGYGELKEALGL